MGGEEGAVSAVDGLTEKQETVDGVIGEVRRHSGTTKHKPNVYVVDDGGRPALTG